MGSCMCCADTGNTVRGPPPPPPPSRRKSPRPEGDTASGATPLLSSLKKSVKGSKVPEIPPEYWQPNGTLYASTRWPIPMLQDLVKSHRIGPFYPPVADEIEGAEECGVCFLKYDQGLHRCDGCRAGVCSDCYIQICPPVVLRSGARIGDGAKCPFCNRSPYTVKYRLLTLEERLAQEHEETAVKTLESKIEERKNNYEEHLAKYNQRMQRIRTTSDVASQVPRMVCCLWDCEACSLRNAGARSTCEVCGTAAPPAPSYRNIHMTFTTPERNWDKRVEMCPLHDDLSLEVVLKRALVEYKDTKNLLVWHMGSVDPPVELIRTLDGSEDTAWEHVVWASEVLVHALPQRQDQPLFKDVIVEIDGAFAVWNRLKSVAIDIAEQSAVDTTTIDVMTAMERGEHLCPERPVNITFPPCELQILHGDIFFTIPKPFVQQSCSSSEMQRNEVMLVTPTTVRPDEAPNGIINHGPISMTDVVLNLNDDVSGHINLALQQPEASVSKSGDEVVSSHIRDFGELPGDF
eukprot:PhF_6_TR19938/c0_g1_i1/m.29013